MIITELFLKNITIHKMNSSKILYFEKCNNYYPIKNKRNLIEFKNVEFIFLDQCSSLSIFYYISPEFFKPRQIFLNSNLKCYHVKFTDNTWTVVDEYKNSFIRPKNIISKEEFFKLKTKSYEELDNLFKLIC